MDLNDKLVKAIYTSDKVKEKIVLEGSYAVYKVIMNDTPQDPKVYNRVIKISDLDIDLYDEIEKLWDEYGGMSFELNEEVFNRFQELFSDVIINLKKEGIISYFDGKKPKVSRRQGNNIASYGFEVSLKIKSNDDDIFEDHIEIDINVIKTPIDRIIKTIKIGGEDVNVQIYKNEKYFANKLMAFNKHLYYYNKHMVSGNLYLAKGNIDKLKIDYFDIVFIQKHLHLDYYKIDEYLKLMGSTLMYDDYVKLINEWVKGGKK